MRSPANSAITCSPGAAPHLAWAVGPRWAARLEPRSGDGPLSVRARPSSLQRDCDRRPTCAGENAG